MSRHYTCERSLKRAILHRKNSLFYRTQVGAKVGDIFQSLIHSAELAKVNPLHYLTELITNSAKVARDPRDWMPWNDQRTLSGHSSTPAN